MKKYKWRLGHHRSVLKNFMLAAENTVKYTRIMFRKTKGCATTQKQKTKHGCECPSPRYTTLQYISRNNTAMPRALPRNGCAKTAQTKQTFPKAHHKERQREKVPRICQIPPVYFSKRVLFRVIISETVCLSNMSRSTFTISGGLF